MFSIPPGHPVTVFGSSAGARGDVDAGCRRGASGGGVPLFHARVEACGLSAAIRIGGEAQGFIHAAHPVATEVERDVPEPTRAQLVDDPLPERLPDRQGQKSLHALAYVNAIREPQSPRPLRAHQGTDAAAFGSSMWVMPPRSALHPVPARRGGCSGTAPRNPGRSPRSVSPGSPDASPPPTPPRPPRRWRSRRESPPAAP